MNFRPLLNRIQKFFGYGYDPAPKHRLAPIVRPPNAQERKWTRDLWWWQRHSSQRIGPPKLTGERLARVQQACSPRHLTVLSKGARLTWNMEKEFQ
jgi:hypothetical protein